MQCHFLFDSPEKTKKNMNLDRRSSWHLFVTFVLFLFDLILCWRFLFLFKTRPLRLGKKNVACDVFIHTHTHTNIHNAFLRMEIIWFWFYFFVPQKKRRKREGSWWWWWWWWRSFGRRGPCSFLSFGYVIWTARACRSQTRGLFSNSLCCRSSFFKN